MKNIKIKFFSISAGIISSLSVFFVFQFPNIKMLAIGGGMWVLLLATLFFLGTKRRGKEFLLGFILLLTTAIAFLALVSLIEWKLLAYLLIVFCGICIALLFRWEDGDRQQISFSYTKKPFRRMIMMLWIFNGYALMTALFAVHILFPQFYSWILVILGGFFLAGVTAMVWSLYFNIPVKNFFVWLLLIGIVVAEFMAVVQALPFGYLVSGFLTTWLWYLTQLFIRFHLTREGIVWKKQIWFIATNAVLFVGFLIFVVRWI